MRQWGTVIVPYSYFKAMDMKVTVIMEKASDGYYSCFVEEDLPGFGLAGYGDTAEAAKEDMLKAYEEIKEMQTEESKEKSITLSAEACRALGTNTQVMTPDELVKLTKTAPFLLKSSA